jgi:hypothetical protein
MRVPWPAASTTTQNGGGKLIAAQWHGAWTYSIARSGEIGV